MILPIFLAVCAAQKHRNSSMSEIYSFEKRVGLHSGVFRKLVMNVLDLPIPFPLKPLWSAKVPLSGRFANARLLQTSGETWRGTRGSRQGGLESFPLFRSQTKSLAIRQGLFGAGQGALKHK